MKRILVLRLSSMGDVLLTLPVMMGILANNPDVEILFVTREKFVPYFSGIDRLTVLPFDPAGNHKGFYGVIRLLREIRQFPFKRVIDLHGILRTHLLDTLLMVTGCRVYRIKKYRKLRREILKNRHTNQSVPHTVIRYLAVFEAAGLTGTIINKAFAQPEDFSIGNPDREVVKVGIAPVSRHFTKNWGLKNVAGLIQMLRLKYRVEIHLFGGTGDHQELEPLTGTGVYNHAGSLNCIEEIALIQSLDIFVTMDSANMHLASLAGIATVSVWGATDPRLGFAPLNQPEDYALYASREEVYCRPCSVYGEIPCIRVDSPMICMTSVRPEQVFNKICQILVIAGK